MTDFIPSTAVTPTQVVPFSPSAGLLEWVEHTLPLSDYLLGPTRTGGAHARYKRPGDLNWVGCYHEVRCYHEVCLCSL